MAAPLPDYLTSPNAVLKDTAKWRYGAPPDYINTRSVYEKSKTVKHEAGSLPELVQNLVKNWEIEASFKVDSKDWRTIDPDNHSFAVNGRPPVSAERFLQLGTYNAVISPNEYYSPEHSTFASSHETFKTMMPTFAWEVLEVYSGPPRVAFKWRHWGVMKNDYVGFNDKGEKVIAKAHGGPIEITGVTITTVDDQIRMQNVETWFDPREMFRQISPEGIVIKATPGNPTPNKGPLATQLDTEVSPTASAPSDHFESFSTEHVEKREDVTVDSLKKMLTNFTAAFEQLSASSNQVLETRRSSDNSSWVKLNSGDASPSKEKSSGLAQGEVMEGSAVVTPVAAQEETRDGHAEMDRIDALVCPFLNQK